MVCLILLSLKKVTPKYHLIGLSDILGLCFIVKTRLIEDFITKSDIKSNVF